MRMKVHRGDFGWWVGLSFDFSRGMMFGRYSMTYDGCRMYSLWILGFGFQLWEAGESGNV